MPGSRLNRRYAQPPPRAIGANSLDLDFIILDHATDLRARHVCVWLYVRAAGYAVLSAMPHICGRKHDAVAARNPVMTPLRQS
jgi:hypothetical protein